MQPYDHSMPSDTNINKVTDKPTSTNITLYSDILLIYSSFPSHIERSQTSSHFHWAAGENLLPYRVARNKVFPPQCNTLSEPHIFTLGQIDKCGKHQSWAKHLSTTHVINMNPQNTLRLHLRTYPPFRCTYTYSKHLMRNNREHHITADVKPA